MQPENTQGAPKCLDPPSPPRQSAAPSPKAQPHRHRRRPQCTLAKSASRVPAPDAATARFETQKGPYCEGGALGRNYMAFQQGQITTRVPTGRVAVVGNAVTYEAVQTRLSQWAGAMSIAVQCWASHCAELVGTRRIALKASPSETGSILPLCGSIAHVAIDCFNPGSNQWGLRTHRDFGLMPLRKWGYPNAAATYRRANWLPAVEVEYAIGGGAFRRGASLIHNASQIVIATTSDMCHAILDHLSRQV
ncbi:hypothetical protein MMC07_005703 [Pseudocyphellaria aurata]|nr:hypothetical protein [Pseudocyphellaria aurata]